MQHYHALKQQTWLQVFTIYLRYLLGGTFIIAAIGMGKLSGSSNLIQSMDKPIEQLQPIQQFFRVMADSGLYWEFIGWAQIAAGILLMTQKLARLGALLFFGMILNIFLITVSYKFQGTPVVTGLMLLASVYLLVWDLPYLLPLFTNIKQIDAGPRGLIDNRYWSWLGLVMIAGILLSFTLKLPYLMNLIIPFGIGLLGFAGYWLIRRRLEPSR